MSPDPARPTAAVAGILLAAGRSSRLAGERPKQLVELGGEPMVRRVARAALGSRLAEVVVVLGHRAEAVGETLADLELGTVENPDFAAGQSTSVRAGLRSLDPRVRAAMFLLADQPLLAAATIDRLIAAWESTGGPIVVPIHRRQRAAPVIFDRSLFGELAELRGDAGGRRLLPRHADSIVTVEVDDPLELSDVDTPEELRQLSAAMPTRGSPKDRGPGLEDGLPRLSPEDFYLDDDGMMVFTALYHRKRGTCCKSGCRHCPWDYRRDQSEDHPAIRR